MNYFASIDQGTTSSRAIVFNSQLNVITDSQQEYSLSYPNDGWVEADPANILNTVRETVSNVLKKENFIIKILSSKLFVGTGLISYSLYLKLMCLGRQDC